jgi:glycerophosphoryl diester phosphodiesterase
MLHDVRDVLVGVQELVDSHRSASPEARHVRAHCLPVPERGYDLLLGLRRPRAWTALRPRAGEIERLNAAGVAVMPYTVDDPGQWPLMRDAGVDAVITNRPGALVGWNARYEQVGNPVAPRAEVLAPAAGARLERGDAVAVAVAVGGARDVAITVDGEPVEEGTVLRADELSRGEHAVEVTADGESSEARFDVVASVRGLSHLVSSAGDFDASLRLRLLRMVLDREWRAVIATVQRHEDEIGEELADLIAGDASAMQSSGP